LRGWENRPRAWSSSIRRHRTINRRGLLGAAAAAGAFALSGSRMARAQHPAPNLQAMTRRLARFEKRIDLIRQSLDVPGMSVAVLYRQDIIFARGLGMVDVAARTQAAVNTPYPIASLTKTFATAVIMRLVEHGKLNLDEPMTTYDPDYGKWCKTLRTGNDSWSNFHCDTEKITVRQFLNHTEQGAPGTSFEYSAFLFARLTAVVDAVSGKGFLRSIEDEVLDPLQMRDTALGSKDPRKTSVVSRMAKPYALNQSEDVVESGGSWRSFDRCNASSGIISTVMDLARYDIGIDRGQVYSAQIKSQIWTPGVSPTGQVFPYGLGWFVEGNFGSKSQLVWHYGLYPTAFSSLLFKVPDKQLTLIFLACSERANSVFQLGDGDPQRSAFVATFLDEFGHLS
jgi:CubicO group peptidase (beta-lactamase class C family)